VGERKDIASEYEMVRQLELEQKIPGGRLVTHVMVPLEEGVQEGGRYNHGKMVWTVAIRYATPWRRCL
jgi:hypothetical protein